LILSFCQPEPKDRWTAVIPYLRHSPLGRHHKQGPLTKSVLDNGKSPIRGPIE